MITYYAGDRLVGLSTDVKPLDIADGATFIETDTLDNFIKIEGAWVIYMSGSNPNGGTIQMATTNYLATLFMQFITLDIAAPTTALVNLPDSMVEPYNLQSNTFLAANYAGIPGAGLDWLLTYMGANGAYLPGWMTPAYLRMVCSFEGVNGTDVSEYGYPAYLSNGAGLGNLLGNSIVPPVAETEFVGGTPISNGTNPELAFDGNESTFCNTPFNDGWVGYDFGVGNEKVMVDFFVGYGSTQGYGVQIYVEASQNGTDWVVIGGGTIDSGMYRTANTVPYRFYRMRNLSQAGGEIHWTTMGGFSYAIQRVQYDTSVSKFGSSSAKFFGHAYLSGAINNGYLEDRDWHIRGFVRVPSISRTMAFASLGISLEVLMTTTGLSVRYSTDGATQVTVNSTAFTWSTNSWHFISVRRTGNTLYIFVDGVARGTVDMTGIVITATGSAVVGADYTAGNMLVGNVDDLEIFVGESVGDAVPTAPSTAPYIPATSWQSLANFIPTGVKSIYVSLLLDEVQFASFGVPVVNTDLRFSISLDNGSTWDELTMVKASNMSTATRVYSASSNATLLNNTNQLVYKVTNAFGKVVKLDGVIIYWVN